MLKEIDTLGYYNAFMDHHVNDNVIMNDGFYKGQNAVITKIMFDDYNSDIVVDVLINDNIKMSYLLSDNLFCPKII